MYTYKNILSLNIDKLIKISVQRVENLPVDCIGNLGQVYYNCAGQSSLLLYEGYEDDCLEIDFFLKKAIKGKLELPYDLEIGQMNFAHMEGVRLDFEGIYKDMEIKDFWVWSMAPDPQTFLYTRDNSIYMEIGYTYPWLYKDEDLNDPSFIPYDTYIASYKPFVVHEISFQKAEEWIEQLATIK